MHLPFGVEQNQFPIVPFSLVATAFASLNTVVGGHLSSMLEKYRRETPLAVMADGKIKHDFRGIGRPLTTVAEETPKQKYLEGCRTTLETNVVTGFFMTVFPFAIALRMG